MNVENAKTLRGQLARLPDEKFHMSDLVRHAECGTVACIAGWASILNGGPTSLEEVSNSDNYAIWDFACHWLGLDEKAANHLFLGRFKAGASWWDTSRAEAIAELDRLIAQHEARP